MIKFTTGDIFTTDCEAIGHGCNCTGHAGKGIVVQVKEKFPHAIREYKKACRDGKFNPGDVQAVKCGDKVIVNMATQETIKRGRSGGAKMDYIKACLKDIEANHRDYGFKSLALPKIGCGLGGLRWGDVKEVLRDRFGQSDLKVVIYE